MKKTGMKELKLTEDGGDMIIMFGTDSERTLVMRCCWWQWGRGRNKTGKKNGNQNERNGMR